MDTILALMTGLTVGIVFGIALAVATITYWSDAPVE